MKTFFIATLLTLGLVNFQATAHKNPSCCSALLRVEGLTVLHPADSLYDIRLDTYYSANAAGPPVCMVLPGTTEDVANIARILSTRNCSFGVRSGAHSAFNGSNGLEGGITVDFGYMNSTTYDPSTRIASVQPGSNWGDVYSALNTFGVTAVGGRASVVGVGGFTTGGGYSFHTGTHGFACDSVVNFEVVLASGTVVNANRHENAELWRALKGGSGNFGFVTKFDITVISPNKIWGGITTYESSKKDEVVGAYTNFVNNNGDTASQAILTLLYGQRGFSLVAVLTNSQAQSTAPAFDEFAGITNVSSTARIGTMAEMVPEFTGPTPLGLYANWVTGTTSHEEHIVEFITKAATEYARKMQLAAPSSRIELLTQLQPVTQSMLDPAIERGGNVLGLERVVKEGPALMWLLSLTTETAEIQKLTLPLLFELKNVINQYADSTGVQKNWEFLNYSGLGQNPILHYGQENVEFLRNVSKKYDPAGVFQHSRQTGFHIQ
ncbi:FAD binding domain-containing protein [Colletotrichum somersetense]|nr:FAD binding domain-containing protein [Colletotrichum somersetense]